MFVVFGTTTKNIKEESGYFVCPEFKMLRPYDLSSMQTWFTLFFIPIFPVGEMKNRHVECKECSSTYYPSVLEGKKIKMEWTIFENEEKAKANV